MYLYLMHYAPLALTKIGISKNPTVRKWRVNVGVGAVKLLAMYQLNNAKIIEKQLHKRFADSLVDVNLPTNEWFQIEKNRLILLMLELKRLEKCQ